MAKPFAFVAAVLFCLFLGVAPTHSIAAESSSQPVLRIGLALEPPHLDPTAGAAGAIDEVVYANLFEGLTRIDEKGAVQPLLAKSWKVSEGGKTYLFQLEKGVLFHDGSTFDSADVVFSLNRARSPSSPNAQKRLFADILSVEAVSSHSVRIKLKNADPRLPFKLGWGDAVMVDPASAEKNRTHPVGTGPFRLKESVRNVRIVLERTRNYWARSPSIARVVFRFLPESLSAQAALLSGEIDVFPNFPAPELLPRLATDERFVVESGTTEGETLLTLNLRLPFFQDLRVRRAIAHAIDREALNTAAMFSTARIIGSHYPPHAPDYLDLSKGYAYDPPRARALLAQAGWSPSNPPPPLVLKLPPPFYARRSGEIIADQLARVGLSVSIRPVEWAQWLSEVFRSYDFDMTIVAHTEPDDMEIYARSDYYFGYEDEEFRSLIESLSRARNPARLRRRAQRHLHDNLPAIFLFQLPKNLVRVRKLSGLWRDSPIQANDITRVKFLP